MSAPPVVLIVDDNPSDIELMQIALEESGLRLTVRALPDGRAAIAELRRIAGVGRSGWPDLVVLDLNMPIVNGHEVLEHVAGDDRLRGLPVIVLTTSSAPADRDRCRALGVADYLVKPRRFADFAAVIDRLRPWLGGRPGGALGAEPKP